MFLVYRRVRNVQTKWRAQRLLRLFCCLKIMFMTLNFLLLRSVRRWPLIKLRRTRVLLDRQAANKGIRSGRDGPSEVPDYRIPADLLCVRKLRVCDRENDVS